MKRAANQTKTEKGMQIACICIGILMIILGIYFKTNPEQSLPFSKQREGEISLLVRCTQDETLQCALRSGRRLTLALNRQEAEKIAEVLRRGMEPVLEGETDVAALHTIGQTFDTLELSGVRGFLLESPPSESSSQGSDNSPYQVSWQGEDAVLSPDIILNGEDASACAAALSQLLEQAQAGQQVFALYTPGEAFPLEEVLQRLEDARLVFLSNLI